mmetsp:Transcript_83219/g.131334  ORF Transcript_83219/g.131334 Transcript_83219/m.131334 type:complete len:100 (+) Transcript_83219:1851-2150(+)
MVIIVTRTLGNLCEMVSNRCMLECCLGAVSVGTVNSLSRRIFAATRYIRDESEDASTMNILQTAAVHTGGYLAQGQNLIGYDESKHEAILYRLVIQFSG